MGVLRVSGAVGVAILDGVNVPGSVLENVVRVAASHPEVRAVYLFGSQVTGDARPDSDLDLGVLFKTPQPLATTLKLEGEFERATACQIDLTDAAHAAAFLALEIVRGERIFCREPTEADVFELYVLRRAGDLLPFERERQSLLGLTAR
jgi:predicted nucleotidyltransferase